MHFGFRDRAHRVSPGDDEIYDAIVALCDDLNDPDARRSFLVRTHLGNYALWLSGIFPDYIEQRRWRRGGPDLEYYEEMGRRGFQLAADHRLAEEHGLATLYATAAERFGVLRCALNAVSDRCSFPRVQSPERLMRQVRDEGRWRHDLRLTDRPGRGGRNVDGAELQTNRDCRSACAIARDRHSVGQLAHRDRRGLVAPALSHRGRERREQRRSQSSRVAVSSSGCHCTATIHQAGSRGSSASMIPSSLARGDAQRVAARRTD